MPNILTGKEKEKVGRKAHRKKPITVIVSNEENECEATPAKQLFREIGDPQNIFEGLAEKDREVVTLTLNESFEKENPDEISEKEYQDEKEDGHIQSAEVTQGGSMKIISKILYDEEQIPHLEQLTVQSLRQLLQQQGIDASGMDKDVLIKVLRGQIYVKTDTTSPPPTF